MNDIIERNPNEVFDSQERIKLDLREVGMKKVEAYLANVLELINAKATTPADIQPEKRYYLDISAELQEMMDRGEAWFTEKKKDGKAIAQLRHIDEEGHNRIFTYPTIKEEAAPHIDDNVPNGPDIYQIAEISEEIEAVRKVVENMHIDIQNNTLAKIESAYNQLLLADSASNPLTRMNQINIAIQTLSEGKQEIIKALETRLNNFERVPAKNINLYIKMFTSKDYLGEKQRELEEICRLFDYFDKAGMLQVHAYMLLNEPESARLAANMHKVQFDNLEISKIKTMSRILSFKSEEDEWFISPESYLENVDKQQYLLEHQRYNGVTLVLTGEQLMEAINYE